MLADEETGASDSSASVEEMQQQVASDVCQLDDNGNPKAGCNEDEDLPWSGAEDSRRKGLLLAQLERDCALECEHEEWLVMVGHGWSWLVKSQEKQSQEPQEPQEPQEVKMAQPKMAPAPVEKETQEAGLPLQRSHRGAAVFREVLVALLLSLSLAAALVWDYLRAAASSQQSKGEVLYINQISSRDLRGKLAGCQKAMAIWALASVAWMMDLLDTTIFSCSMCCGIVILIGRNLQLNFGPKRELHKL
eukprot:Skav212685  [mRNA]  locus=scaffold1930:99227:104641:+ [translate_table: standard]